jgi:hypothetical protein
LISESQVGEVKVIGFHFAIITRSVVIQD